jgi:hypothetical protein
MDGLSGAASVIAVIDISAKIVSLCFRYSMAVKDAKDDIKRVQRKLSDITHILSRSSSFSIARTRRGSLPLKACLARSHNA